MVINLYNSLYSHLQEDTLGKRIKKGRMLLGLSQSDLRNLINIGRSTIDEYESDKVIPSRDVMLKLCNLLGKDLITGEDEYLKFILNVYSKMIYEWRIKNNLSVADADKLFNTDRSNIYWWEKGAMVVSRKTFEKIEDIRTKKLDSFLVPLKLT